MKTLSFFALFLSLLFLGCPPKVANNGNLREEGEEQEEEKVVKQLLYKDWVYEPQIRSVEFYKGEDNLSYPFLYLNDPVGLTLEFDELIPWDKTESDFWLTIENCDAAWNPSSLISIEFLEGFNRDRIFNYRRAENTRIPYVHYIYQMTPDKIRMIKTGNYLLKVFRDGDEEDLVITRRFLVAERLVGIEPMLGQSYTTSDRLKLQRVDFNLDISSMKVVNPLTDVYVIILQNGRWDNAAINLQPTFYSSTKMEYQFNAASKFSGGNEFRFIDIRSTRFRTARMSEIEDRDSIYFVRLITDAVRPKNSYLPTWDMNGGFMIGVQEYPFADYMADYVLAKFSLKYPSPTGEGDPFLLSRYFNWQMTDENKMVYNAETQCYETEVLIKQGVHDYQYVWMPKEGNTIDETKFEGSHYETENNYTILVYSTPVGARTASIVGICPVNYREK